MLNHDFSVHGGIVVLHFFSLIFYVFQIFYNEHTLVHITIIKLGRITALQ